MFSPESSLSRGSQESSSLPPSSRGQMPDLNSLSFPDAPSAELPPIQSHNDKGGSASNHTLPSLSSVTGGPPPPLPPIQRRQPETITHWPSLNPLTAFYAPSHVQAPEPAPRIDNRLNSSSPDRSYGQRAASVSLDDPDVRTAAEALGELRADLMYSPPNRNASLPAFSPSRQSNDESPEPLLSLITTGIPIIGPAVEKGSGWVGSAYSQGKSMSPRVVKDGVEYVEGYLTPVAKVVNNAGRRSGVERGLRWLIHGGRRRNKGPSDDDRGNNKRRKTKPGDNDGRGLGGLSDFLDQDKDRRMSISTVDTLPAYDDLKSPAYTETLEREHHPPSRPGSSSSAGYTQRIMISTSSLGLAVTGQGLQSLKICLQSVRSINALIHQRLEDLKVAMEKYDAAAAGSEQGGAEGTAGDRNKLLENIDHLRKEIFNIVKQGITVVSSQGGAYLPDNVKDIVKRTIMSLPKRFSLQAAQTQKQIHEGQANGADSEKSAREGANLATQFAQEGIELMTRITDMLETTINAAENWLADRCKNLEPENSDSPMTGAESDQFSSSNQTPAHFSAVASPISMSTVDITMGEAR